MSSFSSRLSQVAILTTSLVAFESAFETALSRDVFDSAAVKAFADNSRHGVVAALVWAIFLADCGALSSTACFEVTLAAVLSSLVDVDHFIAAKSLRLEAALSLPYRPFLHCSTLPLVVLASTAVANRLFDFPRLERFGLLTFVSMMSHHTTDGVRRGVWLPPLSGAITISFGLHLALLAFFIPHAAFAYLKLGGDRISAGLLTPTATTRAPFKGQEVV